MRRLNAVLVVAAASATDVDVRRETMSNRGWLPRWTG